jgi:hypothetical protein
VADLSPGAFLLAVALATVCSLLVFRHAEKHGNKHATAWGIGAFLVAGIFVPLYFLRHWLRQRGRQL